MALLSTTYKLTAKVKYDDNGTIKSGSRTIGITEKNTNDFVTTPAMSAAAVSTYQRIITDTITSYEVTTVQEYDGDFGAVGSVTSAWDNFDDVKLINFYTDGDKTYKETIKRPATAATEEQLQAYASNVSSMTDNAVTGINGNYTGSTVESAWTND